MNKIIPIELYSRDLMVHFGEKSELPEFLDRYVEKEEIDVFLADIEDGRTDGRTMLLSNGALLIWMPRKPETPKEHGTLSHEIFHATEFLMKEIGASLSPESSECYAYLTGYLTQKVHELLTTAPASQPPLSPDGSEHT